jgi:vacuolar-type H+-ATPase subunit H
MGVFMAQPDTSNLSSDDRILHELAATERTLQEELVRARAEAARVVEQAQREADGIRAAAREQIAREEAAAASTVAAETKATTAEVLQRAQAEAETIRAHAAQHVPQAVELVVHEVLGGRA